MNLPDRLLPYELSDEAAAHITEILHHLAAAFDSQYFGQVLRYYNELNQRPDIECACHDRQLDLFEGHDLPFYNRLPRPRSPTTRACSSTTGAWSSSSSPRAP